MSDIEKMRVAAVRTLTESGFKWAEGRWVNPAVHGSGGFANPATDFTPSPPGQYIIATGVGGRGGYGGKS